MPADKMTPLADVRHRCSWCEQLVPVNERGELTPHRPAEGAQVQGPGTRRLSTGRKFCAGSRRSTAASDRNALGLEKEQGPTRRPQEAARAINGAWVICPYCERKWGVDRDGKIGIHDMLGAIGLRCRGSRKRAYEKDRFDDPGLDPETQLPEEVAEV